MKYKLAVFDMDGTILNTLDDLMDSLNFALRRAGYPERTLAEVRSFVGNGIRKLVERGVPKDAGAAATDAVFADFSAYYAAHCADKTRPYEGVAELIGALRRAGCKTAVVSNKTDEAVRELCAEYFPGLFDASIGERPGIRKKPAPDSVLEVLSLLGFNAQDAVYIGDSEVDIATAQNAGLNSIIVEWGFRDRDFLIDNGAKVLVSSPREVAPIILGG